MVKSFEKKKKNAGLCKVKCLLLEKPFLAKISYSWSFMKKKYCCCRVMVCCVLWLQNTKEFRSGLT